MKDIPIEQMDERRLRVELSSALTANQLLLVMVGELQSEVRTLQNARRREKYTLRQKQKNAKRLDTQIKKLSEQHKDWGKDQVFHYCTKGIAPYTRLLCSVCPPTVPIDGSRDFNAYERLIELKVENARLDEREQVLDALEAAGVDNWEGYDEAMEILRKIQNGTT